MSGLKDALRSSAATKSNNSSKTPAFYNAQKNSFIQGMANHPDETIRVAVAGNPHVPVGTLKTMLEIEANEDVLRTLLLNPRTPLKAITIFTDDPRAKAFDNDEAVTEYLKLRADANGGAKNSKDAAEGQQVEDEFPDNIDSDLSGE